MHYIGGVGIVIGHSWKHFSLFLFLRYLQQCGIVYETQGVSYFLSTESEPELNYLPVISCVYRGKAKTLVMKDALCSPAQPPNLMNLVVSRVLLADLISLSNGQGIEDTKKKNIQDRMRLVPGVVVFSCQRAANRIHWVPKCPIPSIPSTAREPRQYA